MLNPTTTYTTTRVSVTYRTSQTAANIFSDADPNGNIGLVQINPSDIERLHVTETTVRRWTRTEEAARQKRLPADDETAHYRAS